MSKKVSCVNKDVESLENCAKSRGISMLSEHLERLTLSVKKKQQNGCLMFLKLQMFVCLSNKFRIAEMLMGLAVN